MASRLQEVRTPGSYDDLSQHMAEVGLLGTDDESFTGLEPEDQISQRRSGFSIIETTPEQMPIVNAFARGFAADNTPGCGRRLPHWPIDHHDFGGVPEFPELDS